MGSNQVYEIITDQIIKELEQGRVPWFQEWIGSPKNLVSNDEYTGINALLLGLAMGKHKGPYFLSWNQIQKLGGSVKANEHGYIITYFKTSIFKRGRLNEAGEHEETLKTVPLLRYYRVWNLNQTEGVRVPKGRLNKDNVTPNDSMELIDGYLKREGISLGFGPPSYNLKLDKIEMLAPELFNSTDGYTRTFFHEMAHSTGAASRLGRF